MSDTSMGSGWWQASDGKWYPPRESDTPPEPGWWLAADGKWYPPRESDTPPEPGWWLAADGKWYPPAEAESAESEAESEPEPEPRAATPAPAAEQTSEPATEPQPEPSPVAVARPTPASEPRSERAPRSTATAGAPPRPAAPAPTPAPVTSGANGSNGSTTRTVAPASITDASEQIRRRNQASRDDAVTQFPARFLAAARAVQLLESELGRSEAEPEPAPKKHERKGRARAEALAAETKARAGSTKGSEIRTAESTTSLDGSTNGTVLADPGAAPPAVAEQAAEPAPEPSPTVPVGRPTARPGDQQGWPAPRPGKPAHANRTPGVGQPGGPLLELRPSPLGADLDHLGDRLLVFEDRVELHDRSDHIRQSVTGPDIAEVGVQRKFTGAVLTIAGRDGEPIVVKGLKPEQADEVQRLIQTRLRHPETAPADRSGDALADVAPAVEPEADTPPEQSALAAPSPDAVANAADRLAILNRSRLNEAELLRKLADLHRAGVLSDAEFSEKIALVGRLVSGETIVVV